MAMPQGSAPEAPPHAFAQNGEFCGWLWALDPALFDRSQAGHPRAPEGLYAGHLPFDKNQMQAAAAQSAFS